MSKKTKTVEWTNAQYMGCSSCEYKTGLNNCIKFGVNIKEDINRKRGKVNHGVTLHLLKGGTFETKDAARRGKKNCCPSWTDPKEVAAIRKKDAAEKEKARRAFMDKVRACGSQVA